VSTPAERARSATLRRVIGLVLVFFWVYGWYDHLGHERAVALAQCDDGGVIDNFLSEWGGCRAQANATMHWMVLVLLTAPFMFVFSRFAATSIVRFEAGTRDTERQHAERLARQENELRLQAQERQLQENDQAVRERNRRAELIRKLGTANDYLAILDGTQVEAEVPLLRQHVVRELRDVVVRYTLDELRVLVAADEAVHRQLLALGEGLGRHGMASAEASLLLSVAARGQ